MLVLLVVLCQPEFDFNLTFESALVYNEARKAGGNEMRIGDFVLNPKAKLSYKHFNLGINWVPEESLLDFGKRENWHNYGVYRADGYINRPSFLVSISGEFDPLLAEIGGFRSVQDRSFSQSLHYLSNPITHTHLTTYGKGLKVGYKSSHIYIDASVIDGDWQIGQPDLFRRWDSRANSYPSFAGSLEVRLAGITLGASCTAGDIGSNDGEKRRQNHAIAYFGYQYRCFEVQGYGAFYQRNPYQQDKGGHVPAINTLGYGLDVKLSFEAISFSASIWQMQTNDPIDGEIWIAGNQRHWGWVVTSRWNITKPIYLSAFFGQHFWQVDNLILPKHYFLGSIAIGIDL